MSTRKADVAEQKLQQGGVVSVQVLIEFSSVTTRKFKMSISDVREVVADVRAACTVTELTESRRSVSLSDH